MSVSLTAEKTRREKSISTKTTCFTNILENPFRETKKALFGTSLFVISILRNPMKPVKPVRKRCVFGATSVTCSDFFLTGQAPILKKIPASAGILWLIQRATAPVRSKATYLVRQEPPVPFPSPSVERPAEQPAPRPGSSSYRHHFGHSR